MNWIFLAIISALVYGGYNFFIKLASAQIHQVLAAVILQASALAVGILILAFLRFRGVAIEYSSSGVRFAVLGGVSVAIGEILAFYVFSHGVATSQGTPIIVGGAVAAAALYGMLFLRETLVPLQWLGLVFVVLGIVLLTFAEGARQGM